MVIFWFILFVIQIILTTFVARKQSGTWNFQRINIQLYSVSLLFHLLMQRSENDRAIF